MDKKLNFNQYAKSEILEKVPEDKCCKLGWLCAAVKACGSLSLSKKGASVVFETSNYEYVKSIIGIIKSLYFATLDAEVKNINSGLVKGRVFTVKVPSGHTRTMLTDLGIFVDEPDGTFSISDDIGEHIVQKACCAKSFLASLFVAIGSANVPSKIIGETEDVESSGNGYYLEYLLNDENFSEHVIRLLKHFEILAKMTERNGKSVVYVKDSEAISNFFALLGANDTVLYMQDIIVERLLSNNLNRKSNCEVGNFDKIAIASAKQIVAINNIEKKLGLEKLPEKLRELAELRLNNPTASLDFFVEKVNDVSKSGINHRFRKLLSISEDLDTKE